MFLGTLSYQVAYLELGFFDDLDEPEVLQQKRTILIRTDEATIVITYLWQISVSIFRGNDRYVMTFPLGKMNRHPDPQNPVMGYRIIFDERGRFDYELTGRYASLPTEGDGEPKLYFHEAKPLAVVI